MEIYLNYVIYLRKMLFTKKAGSKKIVDKTYFTHVA